MSKLLNDLIAREDSLGRKPFAASVVHSLINSFEQVDDSIVAGICGKWGSGKSTFIHYLEEAITNYYQGDISKFTIIPFNSWAHSSEKDLQRALLETVLKKIETTPWKKSIKTANEKIKKYLRYLEYVEYIKYVHPIILNIFKGFEEYRKKKEVASIGELKSSVNELIKANGIKLFITIDDLDRLEHTEIVSVFKALKLSVNFTNTVFIVAYDKDVIINALKEVYGSNAEDYLEKIIQVDFAVPELLDEQVENLFFNRLQEFIEKFDLEGTVQEVFQVWKYYGLREYFRNPRDIKRYFNSLLLVLPNVTNNVNLCDFIALEAIKVFDYNAYTELYNYGVEYNRNSIVHSTDFKSEYLGLFRNRTTQSLIRYFYATNNEKVFHNSELIKKRLSDPEFFQRYYTLRISSRDVAEDELKQFLSTASKKASILSRATEYGRIKNLLRRIGDAKISENYTITDETIFKAFLDFWESYPEGITSELDEYIWHAYFNLAHCFHEPARGAEIAIRELEISKNTVQDMRFTFNHFIIQFDADGRIDRQFYGAVKDQLDIRYKKLETSFVENMNHTWGSYFHRIKQGNPNFTCFLFLHSFAKFCREEYIREVTKDLSDLRFLIFLLTKCILRIDAISNQPFGINYQSKELLLPGTLYEEFKQRVSAVTKSSVSNQEFELVEYFLRLEPSNQL